MTRSYTQKTLKTPPRLLEVMNEYNTVVQYKANTKINCFSMHNELSKK